MKNFIGRKTTAEDFTINLWSALWNYCIVKYKIKIMKSRQGEWIGDGIIFKYLAKIKISDSRHFKKYTTLYYAIALNVLYLSEYFFKLAIQKFIYPKNFYLNKLLFSKLFKTEFFSILYPPKKSLHSSAFAHGRCNIEHASTPSAHAIFSPLDADASMIFPGSENFSEQDSGRAFKIFINSLYTILYAICM